MARLVAWLILLTALRSVFAENSEFLPQRTPEAHFTPELTPELTPEQSLEPRIIGCQGTLLALTKCVCHLMKAEPWIFSQIVKKHENACDTKFEMDATGYSCINLVGTDNAYNLRSREEEEEISILISLCLA